LRAFTPLCLAVVLLLSGCGFTTTESSSPSPGLDIAGNVHGGQQPVVGAHVFLFAAGTGGYGNQVTSLLNIVPGQTLLDS